MHQVVISQTAASVDAQIALVQEEVRKVLTQEIPTYSMVVDDDEWSSYVFKTHSDQLWLYLGSLTLDCQGYLAALLENEFSKNRCDELVIRLGGDIGAMLVRRTRDEDWIYFSFVPVPE
jgi:hypothetical protein